jgi:hypothetical protein
MIASSLSPRNIIAPGSQLSSEQSEGVSAKASQCQLASIEPWQESQTDNLGAPNRSFDAAIVGYSPRQCRRSILSGTVPKARAARFPHSG